MLYVWTSSGSSLEVYGHSVLLYAIDICMEFFKAKTYRGTLSLSPHIGIPGLNISKHLAGEGYEFVVL